MVTRRDTPLQGSEGALVDPDATCYELVLVVNGASELSARAILNARRLCDDHLGGRYRLSVVDLHEDPAAVLRVQVVAAPALVKEWPLPLRTFVGDLSRTDKVLGALGLPAADATSNASG